MYKIPALLIASLFALLSWGMSAPAVAAEPSETAGQLSGMDSGHGGKLHRILETFHGKGPRNSESYGDVVLRHINELKLSDEQVGKIARIHRENQIKVEGIARKLRESRRTAYELFLKPASDESVIRKAAKDHTAAFDELVDTALKSRAAMNDVLTTDQLNQLKSFKVEPRHPHDQESTYP